MSISHQVFNESSLQNVFNDSSLQNVFNDSSQQNDFNESLNNVPSQQPVLNDTLRVNKLSKNDAIISTYSIFFMCLAGLPGNVFLLSVYLCNMTTSTRAYMFALAVTDLSVCICGIVKSTIKYEYVTRAINIHFIYMSVSFSLLLLAFVSIERLLAVRRPHTFSLSLTRARRAIVVIAMAAAAIATTLTMGRVKRNRLLIRVIAASVNGGCVLVIVSCYTLMAVTLLIKTRAARVNAGVPSLTSGQGHSTAQTATQATSQLDASSNKRDAKSGTSTKSTHKKQVKTCKDVSVLFIITAVFVSCWLPRWLSDLKFSIPREVVRMYYLNSVVNPFIYTVVSRMFRDDVRLFWRQLRSKLASCHH